MHRVAGEIDMLERELTCPVCIEMYRRPAMTVCGHIFCRSCISRAMDFSIRCPVCYAPLHARQLRDARVLDFLLAQFAEITCVLGRDAEAEACVWK